jgi:cysteine synthase
MPESMSVERRRIPGALGATFDLTAKEKGMKGAIERAQEPVRKTPGAWMPQQFDNPANPEIHRKTTAQEILRDFPERIDYLITGVGTGGHITGVTEVLKQKFRKLQAFAVEPEMSAVISGGAPGPHKLQGSVEGLFPLPAAS